MGCEYDVVLERAPQLGGHIFTTLELPRSEWDGGGTRYPVLAARGGIVHFDQCGFGDYLRIDHEDGWQTTYYHLFSIPSGLVENTRVERGQLLGSTGNTHLCGGAATGIHVHFSIWYVSPGQTFCLGCTNPQQAVWWHNAGTGTQVQIGNYVWTNGSDQYYGTLTNIPSGTQTRFVALLSNPIVNDGFVAGGGYVCGAVIAVQTLDSTSQLYVCHSGSTAFNPGGGAIYGAPAVAFANGKPIYVATGLTGPNAGTLYVRTDSDDWRVLGPSNCTENPGIAVNGSILYVACRGTGNSQLYVGSATVPASGLPSISQLNPASGLITSQGPSAAIMNGAPIYYAVGSSNPDGSGNLYFTTGNGTWYPRRGWACEGHVGVAARGSKAILVCNGAGNNNVWYATSGDAGASWTTVQQMNVFGTIKDGVGVAMRDSGDALVAVENPTYWVYQSWISWASAPQAAQNLPFQIWAGPAAALP